MALLVRQLYKNIATICNKSRLTVTTSSLRHHSHDHDNHHHHQPLYAQHLTNRALVQISGSESRDFLQGLLTNDMDRLRNDSTGLYCGILNAQGRLLYDLIVYHQDEKSYWAECDMNGMESLITFLKRHRLRKKIDIEDMTDGMKIWSIFRPFDSRELVKPDFIDQKFNLAFIRDPRVSSFGWRLVLPEHTRMENTVRNAHEVMDGDVYLTERYKLGLAEGTDELPTGKAFPLESNFDFLNGVSFTKGCYVGQELTARTYHTGVTRKRLLPVFFESPEKVKIGDKIKNDNDRDIGRVRAMDDHYGLALVRIGNLTGKTVKIVGDSAESEATISVPNWWPKQDKELKKVNFNLNRD